MGIFSFNVKENYNVLAAMDDKDPDNTLMCLEFNTIVSKYIISQELHSEPLWKYITETFKNIKNGKNVLQKTDISIDEKNRSHKNYKYYVHCEMNNKRFYMVFYDEYRNLEDEDYHKYTRAEDKSDKIVALTIYYDSDIISSKIIEEDIVSELLKCAYIPSKKNQFFTIAANSYGYELRASYVKECDVDLELNYGQKFPEISEKILDKLKNQKHGLFLLHGESGVGKTFWTRYMINQLSEFKTIIYVPSFMMHSIADPSLISFISGIKDTILLLEDSENILCRSADDRTQAVANILNMTDGLLNDHMDIQIIATFNANAKLIDPALTRAGRLMVNYKFGKLTKEQANKLSKKIGKNKKYDKPTTLAEIYEGTNQILDDNVIEENNKIGFKIK